MLFFVMHLVTLEVELRQGKIFPKGNEPLPEHAAALLTILPETPKTPFDPFKTNPLLHVTFHEDPATPLSEEEWPKFAR